MKPKSSAKPNAAATVVISERPSCQGGGLHRRNWQDTRSTQVAQAHVVAHRILIFGAHPDDAEFHAGGLIARHCGRGSAVRLVSVTDGSAGHHRLGRDALRERRRAEAQAAVQRLGCAVKVWDYACVGLKVCASAWLS